MRTLNLKSKVEDVDAKGIVKIRVSAFGNIDSYGDIMDEKAFNQTLAVFKSANRTRIRHLNDHSWNQMIGLPIEMSKSSKGLDVVSKLNIEKPAVMDIFSDYKFMADNGNTMEHSIGYITMKEEQSQELKANVLKEVDLKEYSTISFLGANPDTPLLDMKKMLNEGEYTPEKIALIQAKIEEFNEQLKALEQLISTPIDEGAIDKTQNNPNDSQSSILLF